jgi:hypothetical protein
MKNFWLYVLLISNKLKYKSILKQRCLITFLCFWNYNHCKIWMKLQIQLNYKLQLINPKVIHWTNSNKYHQLHRIFPSIIAISINQIEFYTTVAMINNFYVRIALRKVYMKSTVKIYLIFLIEIFNKLTKSFN